MDDLFLALFLISILGLIIGLIQPNLFSKLFKKRTSRKTVGLVFGSAIILFFILFGITSETPMSFDKIKSPTNQSSVTLSAINAYKNAKIEFYQDDTKTQELKSDGNGKFSAKVDLKEGDNKFKATATNDKGKSKTSSEINIIYDKTPPTLVLGQTKIETDSDKAEISGETEKNSTLTLLVNDKEIGKTSTKDGKFKFTVGKLKNGENKFILKVTDEAGNIGEQKEVVIIYVPKVAPVANTNTPAPTPTPKPAPTPTPTPTPATHGGLSTDRGQVLEVIKANAQREWGDDYRMVKYEIDNQTEAYDWLIRQTEYLDIMVRAEREWGDDYRMVKYEYENQVEAYKAIQ
ncbi:MAG: hypothetical protein HW405_310 [Candidatus Berkelbacteria bacterium]|nr:hypothetical protein [Candidatus Berkelbacteria bacterium]